MTTRTHWFFCLITIWLILISPRAGSQAQAYQPIAGNRALSGFVVNPTATPDTICPGTSSQFSANPSGGTPPITFLWSPPTGLDDPTSPTPLASPIITETYTVTATDALMQTAVDSVEIFVKLPPDTPGPISGPAAVCPDSTTTHTIAEVYGSTSYSWTVPGGDSIVSGQNTTQVRIKWSGPPGTVSVIAGNVCGNSNPSVLIVSVEEPPQLTGPVEGPGSACLGENIDFSIQESPGATTYLWSVPANAVINSGQGSQTINVTWGSQGGMVSVMAGNFCGFGDPGTREILADSMPGPAGPIYGKNITCLNHAGYSYSVDPIPAVTEYEWELPYGAEITDGKGTSMITVYFSPEAKSGILSIYGKNRCGKGEPSEMEIIVKPCASILDDAGCGTLKIFPNPAHKDINIIAPPDEKLLKIVITDIIGKIKLSREFPPHTAGEYLNQSTDALEPGIYFIQIQGDKLRYTEKLIIR
ncbi:MAG: T9SS type A sorting domain-containing protein [bacterium]